MANKDPGKLAVTVEVSMYPLQEDVEPPIVAFIHDLRRQPGIRIVSNAMSTQLSGSFTEVHNALNKCMAAVLAGPGKVLFVTKTLNLDLAIEKKPELDP